VSNRLGDRCYGDKVASEFFMHCYQLRSNLVHGNLPYPSFEEVGNTCGTLEVFMSDLLTLPRSALRYEKREHMFKPLPRADAEQATPVGHW
jgi:hypothetical protein